MKFFPLLFVNLNKKGLGVNGKQNKWYKFFFLAWSDNLLNKRHYFQCQME